MRRSGIYCLLEVHHKTVLVFVVDTLWNRVSHIVAVLNRAGNSVTASG